MQIMALCLAGLVAVTGLTAARAAEWKMDTATVDTATVGTAAGSRLEFIATFQRKPAPGVFKDFDVRLDFNPEKPAGGRLDVSIRVASADMANTAINQAIAGMDWFDFAHYQQARFHASDIRRVPGDASASHYLARGTLSLKGVQQPVEVPFTWTAAGSSATMEGQFITRRAAFGIGAGEWAKTDDIGANVTVKFRVKLRAAP